MTCPLCKAYGIRVLYMGIPVKLCSNEQCNAVWGFWSFVMERLPFNGCFYAYDGWYLKGLYMWLTEKE